MKTIALTGATSMLGVALINECIQANISVIAFIRPNSSQINRIPKSNLITIIECNLDNLNIFDVEEHKADVFYHIGWAFTDKINRNLNEKQIKNIQYTLDAVKLAKKLQCKRFVGTGSQAEFGIVSKKISSKTPINPLTPYGIAKYAAGKISYIECKNNNIDHIWVRVFSVYGKNDNEGTLINTLISNCAANIPMKFTKCEQMWDYLFETDAGKALFAIGEKGISNKNYCLGSGKGKKILSYINDVISIVNPNYIPLIGQVPYNPNQPMYLVADISELSQDTGWKPEVSFEEGIKKLL